MNKELTPLDALERIGNAETKDTSFGTEIKTNLSNEYRIIETALKNYKQLQIDYDEMNRINDELNLGNHQLRDENIKLKKALKIIKEKKWLVEDILNAFIEDKEKYNLLKEIFKDEQKS